MGRWKRERRLARGLPGVDDSPRARVLQRVATLHLVCLGWVFFRADSLGTAFQLLSRLFTSWGPAPLVTPLLVLVIAGMIAVQYVPRELPARVQDGFSHLRPVAQGVVLAGALFAVTALGPQGVAPFIYFRF